MANKRSLTKTLVKYIILIGSLLCLLTAFGGYQLLSYNSKKQYESTLGKTLDYLEDSLELPLWYLDTDSLEKICNALVENKVIGFIKVFDEDKSILLSINPERGPLLIEGDAIIQHKNIIVGTVEVGLSSSVYEENNKELLFISITTSAFVILGLALFTTISLKTLLQKPLSDLIDLIDSTTQHDYNSNHHNLLSRYGEFNTILKRFNKMVRKVRAREVSLIEAKEKLEKEVVDRKEAHRALEESELNYRDLYENSPDMYVSVDAKTSLIRECNQTLVENLGYTKYEIIGQSIYGMYHPESVEEARKQFQLFVNIGKVENAELQLRRKDGTKIDVILNAIAVRDKNGEILHSRSSWRDISAFKQIKEERNKLELQLQQSQKMESVGNLAGGIAHEFNNMLAIIMGNNEIISEEVPIESLAKESTEEIRVAGLRARDVVSQLMTFSRKDETAKQVMDIKTVVEDSIKLIRSSTPANIRIEQNISPDTYPVMGNETEMNQLLINLCNNAIDALPETGGLLSIELSNTTIEKIQTKQLVEANSGQYIKLVVSDNGIGMNPEILNRIFEPYFTTKDIGEGTGIGMAVVHGVVERHGGEILAESTPGRGSTFTIYFPIYEGLLEVKTEDQGVIPTGNEYILFVDDEPSLVMLGKRLLESLGYTIEATTDAEKALAIVTKDPNKIDLLITDMAMPNMTGDQLVIETLKVRQDIPTIICTGFSAKVSEAEATGIGASSFIMKPFNKLELAKTVRNVLDCAKRI